MRTGRGSRKKIATQTTVPHDIPGWHRLGTDALDWLDALPADWEPHWRILSPRLTSLTVEALEFLEAHRPGAIVAAIDALDSMFFIYRNLLPAMTCRNRFITGLLGSSVKPVE